MSNPKGTKAESAFVKYARAHGFPGADRLPRKGALDEGDVGLCPGVIVELKNRPSVYNPNKTPYPWLEETEVERQRAGALYGILVVKPTGVGFENVGEWHAWVRLSDLVDGGSTSEQVGWTHWDFDPPLRLRVGDLLHTLRLKRFGDPL